MAVPIMAKWDDKKLQGQIARMQREGRDTKPLLKQAGTWMAYKSPELNWKKQGKRYQAAGWPPLSPMTIALRRWAGVTHDKILEVKGELRGRGWSFRVTGSGDTADVEAGTNNPHADKHQKGGWFAAPPRWERPMVKVPQRILIAIADADVKMIGGFGDRHLKKAVPGAR